MKKRALFALMVIVLMCAGALSASAQLRLDMNVNVPLYFGISASGYEEGAWNSNFIPLPEAQLAYQFGQGDLRGGVGARVFTFIIENILYPAAFIELTLDRLVLSANLGGFVFVEFGLLSAALEDADVPNLSGFHNVVLPDLSVSYKFNDWFRLGAGVFMFMPFGSNLSGVLDGFLYAGYIQAKFIVTFE
jgi:hypothetical protein